MDRKVVLITGASSGIGGKTAEYLAKRGYVVFGTSRLAVSPCALSFVDTPASPIMIGMDVVDRIAQTQTDANDRPVNTVLITDMYVEYE
jgi:NADP-dependent 3-hydroxy acid dehydrogenase YdfG